MGESNGHGGKRPGAGRPKGAPSQRQIQGGRVVARKLVELSGQGYEVLADNYALLMGKAVDLALGDAKRPANVALLKTLLELMVKVVGPEPEPENNTLRQLVDGFIDNIQKARSADGPVVAEPTQDTISDSNSRHPQWTFAHPGIPGVGNSSELGSTE